MLASLPIELLELISEHLPADDLLSWRYTCRNAYTASTRLFNGRFIEERAFIFENPDSMRRLTEIVQDPDKRQHLKTVSFLLASLVGHDENQRLVKGLAEQQGSLSGRALRQRMREQNAAHEELYAREDRFRTTGAPITLIRVIQAMRSHGIDIGIKIIDDVGIKATEDGFRILDDQSTMRNRAEGLAAWGYDRICEKLGLRDFMVIDNERHNVNWINVFRALQQTQHAPSTLELGNLFCPVDAIEMDDHWLRQQRDQKPFRNLTTLRLTLSGGEYSVPQVTAATLESQRLRCFINLEAALLHAPKIQTLGLTIGQGPIDDEYLGKETFRTIFKLGQKALPALRTLELEGHTINVHELSHFVLAKKSTLRNLSLRWIANCESKWPQLEHLKRVEDGDGLSAKCREWMEKHLQKGAVRAWEHVYDGKPWFRSERLERHIDNFVRIVPYGNA